MSQVRILGGEWRGQSLAVPRQARPVTARVRATLFSMLASRGVLPQARVLDCFAGSGALGLEALSRGAYHADFIELYPQVLKQNLENFKTSPPQARLLGREALKPPPPPKGTSANLVFADPPWEQAPKLWRGCFSALEAKGWLGQETLLVAFQRAEKSAGQKQDAPPALNPLFSCVESRRVGDCQLVFLRPPRVFCPQPLTCPPNHTFAEPSFLPAPRLCLKRFQSLWLGSYDGS